MGRRYFLLHRYELMLVLRPGDLVFSNHFFHIQLYIGDGRVIEAARPGTDVRISKMLPDRMINAYVRVGL